MGYTFQEKQSFICSTGRAPLCAQGAGKGDVVFCSQIHCVHLVEEYFNGCTLTVKLD